MGPPAGPADSWAVYKGKLYMNFHPQIRAKFLQNPDQNIKDGNARWISLWGDLQAGPFNTDCLAETWNEKPCTSSPQSLPGINPSPSPGPGPSPGPTPSSDCKTTVKNVCGDTPTLMSCEQCCRKNGGQVHPVCQSWPDVVEACKERNQTSTLLVV